MKLDCFFKYCSTLSKSNKQQQKKILWFLDVCTWCSLVCRLAFTCPVLFKWNWRPIRMDGTVDSCDFSREKKSLDWRFLGNIYCMLSTGLHTWTVSTSVCVCVPEHDQISLWKTGDDIETETLTVVELLAHTVCICGVWIQLLLFKKKKVSMWF